MNNVCVSDSNFKYLPLLQPGVRPDLQDLQLMGGERHFFILIMKQSWIILGSRLTSGMSKLSQVMTPLISITTKPITHFH